MPNATDVEGWLKACWPKQSKIPDSHQCGLLAERLAVVRRHENQSVKEGRRRASDFLKEVRSIRRKVRKLHQELAEHDTEELLLSRGEDYKSAAAALDTAHQFVEIAERAITSAEDQPPNPATYLTDGARYAWLNVFDQHGERVKVSLSPGEGKPMTRFVAQALSSIGLDYAENTIVAAQKGKRTLSERDGRPDRREF